MKSLILNLAVCGALAALPALAQAPRKAAKAELKDASGKAVGTATLRDVNGGVRMTVKVKGLAPGQHALHIHEMGKCEAPDFKSAGGHFNPDKKQHGTMNPQGHHAGDLPNITVDEKGNGSFQGVAMGVTLRDGPSNSLFHTGGTAVVIHAEADDMKSDPAGNAGARIACGIII